jgi:hypothetical protein
METLEKIVRSIVYAREKHPASPPVVHDSEGWAKSGAVLVMAILAEGLKKMKFLQTDLLAVPKYKVSVLGIVRRLREQRPRLCGYVNHYLTTYFFLDRLIERMFNS